MVDPEIAQMVALGRYMDEMSIFMICNAGQTDAMSSLTYLMRFGRIRYVSLL